MPFNSKNVFWLIGLFGKFKVDQLNTYAILFKDYPSYYQYNPNIWNPLIAFLCVQSKTIFLFRHIFENINKIVRQKWTKYCFFWSCTCKLLTYWKLKTKKVFIRLVPKNYYSFPSKNVFICLLFLKILRVSLHPGMTSMFEIISYTYIKLGRSQGGSLIFELYYIFMH